MSKDYTKVIVKINRETKEDKITWNKVHFSPTSLSGSEEVRGGIFETKVLEKNVILYRYQYRHYTDEDEYHLIDGYKLDFVDRRNQTEWSFPFNNAIEELYETVQFKMADVDSFLDSYLEGEEDDTIDF